MQLSIIIVNYNVRDFIDFCLHSVKEAIKGIKAEVFVVDNNSNDDSVEYLKKHHSWIQLIENKDNPGFSKANNQAIKKAKGKYILLLNPDTLVEENTFSDCINFMDTHTNAGGLGVKMIGGDGRFQVESKRGIPSPMVSFYKMSGLSSFFPKSKRFAHYNLSYLPENETNEIEILSGAFMFLRKSVLDKIGMLDERFFMYGEDIDLSYRIIKAGFKNYYFPKTKILHFKGESTKVQSSKYIYTFYNAMLLFAEKHYSSKGLNLFIIFIKFAIYFRIKIEILRLSLSKKERKEEIDFIPTNSLIIVENESLTKKLLPDSLKKNNVLIKNINHFSKTTYVSDIIKLVHEKKINEIIISSKLKVSILLNIMYLQKNSKIQFKILNTDSNLLIFSIK